MRICEREKPRKKNIVVCKQLAEDRENAIAGGETLV
jgi:hypothetical protein